MQYTCDCFYLIHRLKYKFFSPHLGNMTGPPELGIFCINLNNIGKNTHHILGINEKSPVSKFRYFGKYIIQVFGYCYVHVTGQRHAGLERYNSYTSPAPMVHMMHILFMFFRSFKNLKSSFSEDNMPKNALEIFIENTPPKWFRFSHYTGKMRIKIKGSPKTLHFPIQCNGNYRGPSRKDYNAFGCDGYIFP